MTSVLHITPLLEAVNKQYCCLHNNSYKSLKKVLVTKNYTVINGFVHKCNNQIMNLQNGILVPETHSNNFQYLQGKWKEHKEEHRKTYLDTQTVLFTIYLTCVYYAGIILGIISCKRN